MFDEWNAQRNGSKFAIFYITIAYENPNCFLHFLFHAIFKKKYLIVCLLSGSFYLSLNIMSRLKDFLDLFFRSKILLRQSETAAAAVQVLYAAVYMSVNFHVKKNAVLLLFLPMWYGFKRNSTCLWQHLGPATRAHLDLLVNIFRPYLSLKVAATQFYRWVPRTELLGYSWWSYK